MDVEYDQGFSSTVVSVGSKKQTIVPDLEKYHLPEDVKRAADDIYRIMGCPIKRKRARLQLLFFCSYCGYMECGKHVDKHKLGTKFGLNTQEIKRSSSLFSPHSSGYTPPDIETTAMDHFPEMCEDVGIVGDTYVLLIREAEYVLTCCPRLRQSNPKTVAAGIIKYYTTEYNIQLNDPSALTRAAGVTDTTIKGIHEKIKEGLNKFHMGSLSR